MTIDEPEAPREEEEAASPHGTFRRRRLPASITEFRLLCPLAAPSRARGTAGAPVPASPPPLLRSSSHMGGMKGGKHHKYHQGARLGRTKQEDEEVKELKRSNEDVGRCTAQ